MSVLQLKPYTLEYLAVSDGSYNSLGEYIEGESTWAEPVEVDAVRASGNASVVSAEDGQRIGYSWTVYMPADYEHDFKFGDRVRITFKENDVREFDVKGYVPYQTQKKLYVG